MIFVSEYFLPWLTGHLLEQRVLIRCPRCPALHKLGNNPDFPVSIITTFYCQMAVKCRQKDLISPRVPNLLLDEKFNPLVCLELGQSAVEEFKRIKKIGISGSQGIIVQAMTGQCEETLHLSSSPRLSPIKYTTQTTRQ